MIEILTFLILRIKSVADKRNFDYSGGSRIPHRRGRQPSRGAPTYDFAKFCEKLHDIEKILGRGGVHAGCAPPKSTTGLYSIYLSFTIFWCYRSGTVNSNTVNSKFHIIRSYCEYLARILSIHV